MDNYQETKVRGLLLRGFSKDEISKLLDVPITDIENINLDGDIQTNSAALYTDLQKDLSKLVLKEMQKNETDGNIILNSIKLQAELQDKKVMLSKGVMMSSSKISRSYIKDRDKEIEKLFKDGITKSDIAQKLGISPIMIDRALDRCKLNLSDELWEGIDASVIDETVGLDDVIRVKVLDEAFKNKYTKRKVREIVTQIKNETRK